MTNNLESGPTQGDTTASGALQGQGDKQASVDAKALADALRTNPELQSAFDELVTKKLQSEKDRRINKQEQRLDKFEERLTAYEKYRAEGLSPEKARQQLDVDEALAFYREQRTGTQAPTQAAAGTRQAGPASDEAMELLKEAGLNQDDPEVVKLLRETDESRLATEVAKLVVRRATAKPPTPGQVIQPSGGNVPAADLAKQYEAEKAKFPPGSHGMLELRNKYRKLGLNI